MSNNNFNPNYLQQQQPSTGYNNPQTTGYNQLNYQSTGLVNQATGYQQQHLNPQATGYAIQGYQSQQPYVAPPVPSIPSQYANAPTASIINTSLKIPDCMYSFWFALQTLWCPFGSISSNFFFLSLKIACHS